MFAQRTVFLGLPPSADMLRCISANVPSAGLAAVFEKPNKATSTVTPPPGPIFPRKTASECEQCGFEDAAGSLHEITRSPTVGSTESRNQTE